MYRNTKIAVIAPCYNENGKIQSVCKRVLATGIVDELIVVDDGSTDHSGTYAKDLGATVLRMDQPSGIGSAIRAGLKYAKNRAEILVVIAGNNKDEPNEMPRLLDPIIDGKADFVQGSRYLKGGGYGGEMPFYRKIATRLHPFLFSLFTGKKVTESTNGFRAFRKTLLEDERIKLDQSWLDGYELEPYLYFKVVKLGYRTAEAPVTKIYPPKKLGNTKMIPLIDWWRILRPLFLCWWDAKK